MRIIGLDIHHAFAETVAWENGKLRWLGRVDMRCDLLGAFAAIANPKQVRIIAHAKIKTDTIDAAARCQWFPAGSLDCG